MSSSKLIEAFGDDVINFSASFDCGSSCSFSKLLKLGQDLVNHDFDNKSLIVAGVSNSKNSIASYLYLLNTGHSIVLTSGKNKKKKSGDR